MLNTLQETICDMQPNPGHKILIRHFLSASKRQEFVEFMGAMFSHWTRCKMKKWVIGVQSSQKTGAQSAVSTILQKGVTVQYSENEKASNRQHRNFHRVKKQNISFFFFLFTKKAKHITN